MRYGDRHSAKQSKGDEATFVIGIPIILKSEYRPGKYLFGVHEVDMVGLEVLLPLRLVPLVAHLQSV